MKITSRKETRIEDDDDDDDSEEEDEEDAELKGKSDKIQKYLFDKEKDKKQ